MIKEEFKDLPEEEFVPLECIRDDFKGLYKINKLGQVLTIRSGKIRNGKASKVNNYPTISFSNQSTGSKPKSYYVHLLVAKTFLIKPEEATEVDHIDSDPKNYNVNNLNWVTRIQNLAKVNRSNSTSGRNLKKYDKDWNFLGIVSYGDIPKEDRLKITQKLNGSLYNGFRYLRALTTDLYEYLNYLGLKEEDLDSIKFVKAAIINDDNALVSEYGIFKINGKYTIGGNRHGYRSISIGKSKVYSSHRVVYATFSGEILLENDVIDHINTKPFDNQFSNLRKTDFKGNMNNVTTLQKKRKSISKYSLDGKLIKEYSSSLEILNELGIKSDHSLKRCCLGGRVTWKGYIWIYTGEDIMLADKLNKVGTSSVSSQLIRGTEIKVFDTSGNLLKTFNSKKEASDFVGVTENRISKLLFTKSLSIIGGKYIICYNGNENVITDTIDKYRNPFSDKETCRQEAIKYSSRTEFFRGSHMAYDYSVKNGWIDEFFPVILPRKVKQYDLSGNYLNTFESGTLVEKLLGIKNVQRVCNGQEDCWRISLVLRWRRKYNFRKSQEIREQKKSNP